MKELRDEKARVSRRDENIARPGPPYTGTAKRPWRARTRCPLRWYKRKQCPLLLERE
jgi:hypothetical protein